LKKKSWNTSSSIPKYPLLEETFERKLMRIRMGLLDQPIQKIIEPKIEPGCDLRDDYTGWSVSTELPTIYQGKVKLQEETQHALEKSKHYFDFRKTQNLSKTDYIRKYNNPTGSITRFNEDLRKIKEEDQVLREELKRKFIFENPAASQEKVDAGVFRLVHEHKIRIMKPKSEFEAKNLTFKPDMEQTLRNEKYNKQYHNGKWGTNAISKDKEVWSCCMNEEAKSAGCNKIEIDPKRWNLASYC